MRHFATLDQEQIDRLFLHPPRPVDVTAGRDELAVALGATLYCPATREGLAGDLLKLSRRGVLSAVACLEDSVPDHRVAEAEEILVRELAGLARTPQWQEGGAPLMLFLRARTPEQLLSVVERAGVGLDCLLGFVIPKFGGADQASPQEWLQAVQKVSDRAGRRMWAMPVLESREVAHLDTRQEWLFQVREVLDAHRDTVLAVRTGATDLSAAYGLRRPRGATVWDVRVVAHVLADVINVLGRADGSGYPITAPVWEHFTSGERVFRTTLAASPFAEGAEDLREQLIADDLDGLVRELELDRVNGLQGKTVIHPTHVAVVHAMSTVTHEDFSDASDVLAQHGGGAMASAYRNKMNEAGPHRAWAERVLARANAFGVAREDISYAHLLQAQDDAWKAYRSSAGGTA